MALFHLDASALVKLVRDEPETSAQRSYLVDADLVSCELVLAEIPRAVRRAAAYDRRLPLDTLLERFEEVLDAVAMLPATSSPRPEPSPSPLRGRSTRSTSRPPPLSLRLTHS